MVSEADDTDDDLIVQCEMCDSKHHMDDTRHTVDGCYICPECWSKWAQHIRGCQHEWSPEHDDHGEPGQICGKCSVLILDCDMPDFLAGKIAL